MSWQRAGESPALFSNTLAFCLRFCEESSWLVLCGSLALFGFQSDMRTGLPALVFQAWGHPMSVVESLSDAQLFFLAFLLLSSPVFIVLYLRGALTGINPNEPLAGRKQPALERPRVREKASEPEIYPSAARTAVTDAQAPLLRESAVMLPAPESLPGTLETPAGMGPRPVQFSLKAPAQVPGNHDFEISVEIESFPDRLKPADEMPLPITGETCGSPVEENKQESRLALILECMPIADGIRREKRPVTIYAPFRAVSWKPRPLRAKFAARSHTAGSKAKANMVLWITGGGIALGAIDFEIAVDPSAETAVRGRRITPNTVKGQSLESNGSAVLATTTLFKRVFVCCGHQEREKITEYISAIDAAKLAYRCETLGGDRPDNGLISIRDWLKETDFVYIFWSHAVASSPAIHKELELIRAERIRRKYQHKAGQSKRLGICVIKLDNCLIEPPSWLYSDGGYTCRRKC